MHGLKLERRYDNTILLLHDTNIKIGGNRRELKTVSLRYKMKMERYRRRVNTPRCYSLVTAPNY